MRWLQYYKKHMLEFFKPTYLAGRKLPRLRVYMHHLFYRLFNLKNRRSAQKHFNKRAKRTRRIGFAKILAGLGNRLDVVLLLLKVVPTLF
jgi:hypothetical protein